MKIYFVTDLHGDSQKYLKLFKLIENDPPELLLIGGDLLPSGVNNFSSLNFKHVDFINGFLAKRFNELKEILDSQFPKIFLILGNDDARIEELAILDAAMSGTWKYIHNRKISYNGYDFIGYNYVPPTPFQLKDWERYDVSRYVDPGCISPEEGIRTIPISQIEAKFSTIQKDLDILLKNTQMNKTIFLFHAPPYKTNLDRANLDGKMIDHIPLDVHVGSIAIKRFIESNQPLLTLHGHVHESTEMTNEWKETIGNTIAINGANNDPRLCIIKIDLGENINTERILI